MKNLKKFSILLLCSALCVSCASKFTTVTVSGTPGTKIYDVGDDNPLGTINNDGIAEISIPRDNYYAFLVSKDKYSNKKIPFALDYKNNSQSATQHGLTLTGYILGGAGAMAFGGGLLMTSPMLAAGGVGIACIGGTMSLCAAFQLDKSDVLFSYKYTSQHTNNDIFKPANTLSTK